MEVVKKFNKRKGTSGVSGQFYEIKLAMLFLLEAIRRKEQKEIKSFYLASNIEEGQSFDDVVITYRYVDANEEEKSSIIFLQAKHKEKEEKKKSKISIETLLSTTDSGDFILRKYVSSFIKIKQQFAQDSDHPIFKNKLEDSQFIIYTNASFDFDKTKGNVEKKEMEPEHFLNVTENKTYYKLSNTERVINVLQASLDYETLTKTLAQSISSKTIDMNKPIVQDYHNSLARTVITRTNKREGVINEQFFSDQYSEFSDAVVRELQKNKNFSGLSQAEIKQHLLGISIQLPEKFGVSTENDLKLSLPQKFVSNKDLQLFVDRLKLFTDQPNEGDLTEIIKNKIQMVYKTEQTDIDMIFSGVEHKVRKWWKDEDDYLTETNTFFQDTARFSFYFDVKLPTELFTGRKRELTDLHQSIQRSINKVTVISQMTTISGLGGIGKTELSRQYVKEYNGYYDNNIIWINAENDTSLIGSFLRLAEDKLKISTKNKNFESVVEEVYQFFSNRKSLFVFDNVENCNTFIKILPLHSLKPPDNRPYILITSRRREWEKGIEVIDLYVLDPKEAVELVKKGLDIHDDLQDEEIEHLVNKLQCFPLALRQAIAYIEDECLMGDYTISDYLEEFEDNTKDLLDSELFQGIDNDYAKTTYTTWKITINKISLEPTGETALKILNIMAFISNEHINRDMFLSLSGIKEKQLKLSVRLLIKYCMINSEQKQSVLSVHKLVQEVTRLGVSEQHKELEIAEESCSALKKYYPFGSQNMTDLARKRQLLPHIETLLSRVDTYFGNDHKLGDVDLVEMLNLLNDGYYHFDPRNEKKTLEKILKIITDRNVDDRDQVEAMIDLSEANRRLGEFQTQKDLLEQTLQIQEKFPIDINQKGRILTKLAFAYGYLGNPQRQIELLEEVLKIQESYFGPDQYQIAIAVTNLAVAYGNLGNPQQEKKLLERALELEEKYGPDDHEIVKTLTNLALAYGNCGEPKQQIELLKRAFELAEKYYGPDHSELARILTNIGSAYGRLGQANNQIEMLERALKLKENFYGSDHYEIALLEVDISSAYSRLGNFKKQKELLDKALIVLEKYYGADHIVLVTPLLNLATAYFNLGDPLKTKNLLDRVLTIQRKRPDYSHYELSKTLIHLGVVHGALGDAHKQKEYLEQALDIQQKHYGPDYFELAITLSNLSNAYGSLGDYQKQKQLTEQVLQLQTDHYGSDHFEVARTLVNLSIAQWRLGNSAEQKNLLEQALTIVEQHYGPDHPEVAFVLINLAISYGSLGDPQRQIELLEKALVIQTNHFGSDHYQVALILINLGVVYGTLGEPRKQKEILERALVIYENHYGPDHFQVSKILTNLGVAYGNLGNPLKQKELLQKSLAMSEKHYGANHCEIARILTNLSLAYHSLGESEEQKRLLERAIRLSERHYGVGHLETAIVLINLGLAHGELGNPRKQIELQEKALHIQRKSYGGDNLEVARSLICLSTAYKHLEHFGKQIEFLDQAMEIYGKHYDPNHIQFIPVLEMLGEAYGSLEDYQKQQDCLERIVTIQENAGLDQVESTEVLLKLGELSGIAGDSGKQKELIERVLMIQEKHYGREDFHLIEALEALGGICGKLGDESGKKEILQRISEIRMTDEELLSLEVSE